MPISKQVMTAAVDDFFLDPKNPRLGRGNTEQLKDQEEVLRLMREWALEEIAVSYLESGGFWVQEALLVVKENLYGVPDALVVVEGNRRLAALKLLKQAVDGNPHSRKWEQMVKGAEIPPNLFTEVPYLTADAREDVEAYLGFRHVTGIKQWRPEEKAEYIARLIEKGNTYEQVMRLIGSQTPTVRRSYIAYNLLRQIEEYVQDFPEEEADKRFSVMYLSLRTSGVQRYLGIDINAGENDAKNPVKDEHVGRLDHYSRWIFGTQDHMPLFTDSRQVDEFGRILSSDEGVSYLENTSRPRWQQAVVVSGGREKSIVDDLTEAAESIDSALGTIHYHSESQEVRRAFGRLKIAYETLDKVMDSGTTSDAQDEAVS